MTRAELNETADRTPPAMAAAFGFAGLIPFVALAAVAIFAPAGDAEPTLADRAERGLNLYGAAILSFLGGCRWGFSSAGLGGGPTAAAMALAVAPSLWAWGALWALTAPGPALAAGVAAMYAADWRAARRQATPSWWLSLRLPLTIGAALSLAAPALF